jgi:hypothetical protein
MTISDDRSVSPAPPPAPPSFVRRHPIVAGFGVLSALSLFSALWPVSAIVITVAIAGHVTGLDRAAWSLTRIVATRVAGALRGHAPVPPVAPAPVAPEPVVPTPPSGPKRDVHSPAPQSRARSVRGTHSPSAHPPVRERRPRTPDHPVETRIGGPEL